jgi:site-specific recombinase XerD
MQRSIVTSSSISAFTAKYEEHLLEVRGLSRATCAIHRQVVQKLLRYRFPNEQISWKDFQFSDCVGFLTQEFARLSNRETQKAWLMVMRSVMRYLGAQGYIAKGWDAALPKITSYRHASLPRTLSAQQLQQLWEASEGKDRRHLRYRALLLLCLRLGLRVGEVANLQLQDIDWKDGYLRVRGTKSHRDRTLPLPEDVGEALVAYLQAKRPRSTRVFEPLRPPFTAERVHNHVVNSLHYLFSLARITSHGTHSLRHTSATSMVNEGASFKAVADVLGHKRVSTTLIYAKLNLKALAQAALPWPGGAQ